MSKCNLNLNGIPVENAENSNLYRQLENYFQGDVNKAVNTWVNVFTEDFGYITKKNKVKSNRLDSNFNSKILLQEEQELIKGLGGKKTDLNDPINVHPDVQGVFSTTNIKVAEQYKGDKGISVFKLPIGTTIEYITVKSEGLPLSKIREEETRLINESTSDVIKLDTIDGRGSEIQFIIKDEAILQDAKPFSNIDITEPSLKEALIISETLNTEKAKLDLEDIIDIKNTMSEKGIESSKELLRQLNSLFRSKGYFEIDENKLYKNNFFTRDEVNNLVANPKLQDKLAETIRALDNQDEFFNPLSKLASAFNHKNYSKTNVLGGYKNIPYTQIEEDLKEIGAETTNIEDFKSQLSQYGYEGILAKMENDTRFLDKIYDEYSTFKKIDSYEIVRGELQPVEKGLSKSLLTKTMLEGVSSTEIREDIDFVRGIEEDVWLEVAEDIKLILKEVEKEAIKFNIDLIGFSEKYQDREGVIDLLNNLEDVTLLLDKKAIDNPTIDKFIESYNNLFPEVENNYVLEQNDKYPENTVYIRTTASDTIMFDDYGLISLGGGFYHAVDMDVSIEELEASVEAEIKNKKKTYIQETNKKIDKLIKVRERVSGINGTESSIEYFDKTGLSFREGDLKRVPEPLMKFRGGRGTGHFGTGFYFTGYTQKLSEPADSQRQISTVDFRDYKLLRVINNQIGLALHDSLKKYQNLNINQLEYLNETDIFTSGLKINGELDDFKVNDFLDTLEDSLKLQVSDDFYNKNLKGYLKEDIEDDFDLEWFMSRKSIIDKSKFRYLLGRLEKGFSLGEEENTLQGIFEQTILLPSDYKNRIYKEQVEVGITRTDKKKVFSSKIESLNSELSKVIYIIEEGARSVKEIKSILNKGIISKLRRDPYNEKHFNKTTLGTELIKLLGYNGIDVRGVNESGGMTGLDNFSYGSVIYDINDKINKNEQGIIQYGDPLVLNNTKEKVLLKKSPFKTENIIKYNLYAELYNYNIESKESVLPQTQSIDIDYLKGNFKDDLYSYILKEKIKDSSIYNNLLKDITIDANGINTRNIDRNLLTTIASSDNILNNLVNYGALRRDSGFESLITNPSSNAFNSLFKEINSDIKEVTTDYIQEGDFIITNSFENFINVNEVIYQEVSDNLFKKVAEVDPVFNNIPLTNKVNIPVDILKKSIKFNESILLNDENLLSLSNINSLKETTERIECNG